MKPVKELHRNLSDREYEEIVQELSQNALMNNLIILTYDASLFKTDLKNMNQEGVLQILAKCHNCNTESELKATFKDNDKIFLLSVYSIYLKIKQMCSKKIAYLLIVNIGNNGVCELTLIFSNNINFNHNDKDILNSFITSFDKNQFQPLTYFYTWLRYNLTHENRFVKEIKHSRLYYRLFWKKSKAFKNEINLMEEAKLEPLHENRDFNLKKLPEESIHYERYTYNINILLAHHLIGMSNGKVFDICYYPALNNLNDFDIVKIVDNNLTLDTGQVVSFATFTEKRIMSEESTRLIHALDKIKNDHY